MCMLLYVWQQRHERVYRVCAPVGTRDGRDRVYVPVLYSVETGLLQKGQKQKYTCIVVTLHSEITSEYQTGKAWSSSTLLLLLLLLLLVSLSLSLWRRERERERERESLRILRSNVGEWAQST